MSKPSSPEEVARRVREAGERAKAEAEARRAQAPAKKPSAKEIAKEIGGQAGPDPTRYGDWEKNGIASDF